MSSRPPASGLAAAGANVWERWGRAFNIGFIVVLALTTVSTTLIPSLAIDRRLAATGLSVLLGIWHWRLIVAGPAHRPGLWRVLLYFTGACALFIGLTSIHPSFMAIVFFYYLQLFWLLPGMISIPLSGPFTLLVWWRGAVSDGHAFTPTREALMAVVVVWLSGAVLGLFIDRIIIQSERRREIISELAATRDELAAAERQAGIVDERQRLAHEIHDTLAQGFASIVLHLEAAEAALPPGSTPVHHHLDEARRTARESLAEARRLVWALRPASLEHSSLAQALTRLATRWSEESGVPARFVLAEDAASLHPELEVTLLRAAQEALTNVRKHAHATAATLTLTIMSDLVTLDIQDDGIGFAPSTAVSLDAGGGFGLTSLRERIERLGGMLTIESAPGTGTTVAIALPTMISVAFNQRIAAGVER